ncbi:MAG: hypothetical protein LBT54_00435 [Bifidobacteriaceae bacterium]|jgi:hypothetical protein|nr:hypothetical protein [Bifidobacteriaceae bacterium]
MASTAVRQRLPDGGAEYHLIGPIMVFELPDARLCGLLGESGLTLAEREHFRAELPGPARPSIQFSMQYARMPCRALGMERAAHLRFEFA